MNKRSQTSQRTTLLTSRCMTKTTPNPTKECLLPEKTLLIRDTIIGEGSGTTTRTTASTTS